MAEALPAACHAPALLRALPLAAGCGWTAKMILLFNLRRSRKPRGTSRAPARTVPRELHAAARARACGSAAAFRRTLVSVTRPSPVALEY